MNTIFNDPDKWEDKAIVTYGDYKPWSWHIMEGGNRSNYPEFSGRILDLKEGMASAVEYFRNLVEPDLGQDFTIAVVPPHNPDSDNSGLRTLAAKLAQQGNRIDSSDCLARTVKIEKLAHGGDRRIEVHLRSVKVMKPELAQDQDVLLLDDVTRTGNSLYACRKLLIEAGARDVRRVALGRTG